MFCLKKKTNFSTLSILLFFNLVRNIIFGAKIVNFNFVPFFCFWSGRKSNVKKIILSFFLISSHVFYSVGPFFFFKNSSFLLWFLIWQKCHFWPKKYGFYLRFGKSISVTFRLIHITKKWYKSNCNITKYKKQFFFHFLVNNRLQMYKSLNLENTLLNVLHIFTLFNFSGTLLNK